MLLLVTCWRGVLCELSTPVKYLAVYHISQWSKGWNTMLCWLSPYTCDVVARLVIAQACVAALCCVYAITISLCELVWVLWAIPHL